MQPPPSLSFPSFPLAASPTMHSPTPLPASTSTPTYRASYLPPSPPRSTSPSSRHDRRRSSGTSSSSDSSPSSIDSWGNLRRDARTPGTSDDENLRREEGTSSSEEDKALGGKRRPFFSAPGSTSLAVAQAGPASGRSGARSAAIGALPLPTPPGTPASLPDVLAPFQPPSSSLSLSLTGSTIKEQEEEEERKLLREVDELIRGEEEHSDSDWSVSGGGDVRDDEDDGDGEDTDISPRYPVLVARQQLQSNAHDRHSSSSGHPSRLNTFLHALPLPRFLTRYVTPNTQISASYLPLHTYDSGHSSTRTSLSSSRLPSFLPHPASHPRTSTSSRRLSSSFHSRQPIFSSPPLYIKLIQTLSLLILPPIFLAIPIAISLWAFGDLYVLLGLYFFDMRSTAYTALFWVLLGVAIAGYGYYGFWMIVRMGKGLQEVWSSGGSSSAGRARSGSVMVDGERRRRKIRRTKEREAAVRGEVLQMV